MSSAAQTAANIANAQSSTGPRTEAGRAASSKNSVTLGLFSGDFIRPGEETAYETLKAALLLNLAPVGALEEILAEEVHRAAWRLRRCGQVESRLVVRLTVGDKTGENVAESYIPDPMDPSDPDAERTQKSVDRARSQAHRLFHKSTSELRKLQTERQFANELFNNDKHDGFGLVEWRTLATTRIVIRTKSSLLPLAQRTQSGLTGTPRNAPCHCGSGEKYKRCCGKDAPAVLHAA